MMKVEKGKYFGGAKPEPYFAIRMEQIANGYLVSHDTEDGCTKHYTKDEKEAAALMVELTKKSKGEKETEKEEDD